MELNDFISTISKLFNMEALELIIFTALAYLFVFTYKGFKKTYDSIRLNAASEQNSFLEKYNELLLFVEQKVSSWSAEDYKKFELKLKNDRLLIEYNVFNKLLEKIRSQDIDEVTSILEGRIENLYFKTRVLMT